MDPDQGGRAAGDGRHGGWPGAARTRAPPAVRRRVLDDVRRQGYAVTERQVTPDAVSVAAPVRDRRGEVVAALSVVATYDESAARVLVPLVVTAALGVSRAIGYRPRR